MYTSYSLFQKRSGIFTESHFKIMHHSIPTTNIPWATPGFCTYFHPGSWDLYHLNCPGVAWRSDLLYFIKVPSCQLIPHESTFQLQTDIPSIAALLLQNPFQSWRELQNFKSGTLPETRGYDFDSFQFFLRFNFCKIPKFRRQPTGKAD